MIVAAAALLVLLRAPMPPVPPLPTPFCAVTCTEPSTRQQRDHWFGEDKTRHLAMAFFTTAVGQATMRAAGLETATATAVGAAGAVVASIGKEVFDRRAGGPFSFRDLVWDAAGIAVGVALVRTAR